MSRQLKLNMTVSPKDPASAKDGRLAQVSQILSDKGIKGIHFLQKLDKVFENYPVKYTPGTPVVVRVVVNLDVLNKLIDYDISVYGLEFKTYIAEKLSYLNLPKHKKRGKVIFPATHTEDSRIYIDSEMFESIVQDRLHTLNSKDIDASKRSIVGTLKSYNIYVK